MRVHHNLSIDCDKDNIAVTSTENSTGNTLMIDHNIFWPANGRIMKLATGDVNKGLWFIHNTYFGGSACAHSQFTDNSRFENNLFFTEATDCWNASRLGDWMPNEYNCVWGSAWTGVINTDPLLGTTPATRFVLQNNSPVINKGRIDNAYYQTNVKDWKPDLGALEHGQTVDD